MLFSGTTDQDIANRRYLIQFCNFILEENQTSNDKFEITDGIPNHLLEQISDYTTKSLLKSFFDLKLSRELSCSLAKFLKELHGNASLFNFFPKLDREWLKTTFEALKDSTLSDQQRYMHMAKLHDFRVQFNKIMNIAFRYQKGKEVASFFQYLIHKTDEIHQADSNNMPDDPEELAPYNPSTGVALYFTSHGGQIRRMPRYKIEGVLNTNNVYI
jgi:hypothetical protein